MGGFTLWSAVILVAAALVLGSAIYIGVRWSRAPAALHALVSVASVCFLSGLLAGLAIFHFVAVLSVPAPSGSPAPEASAAVVSRSEAAPGARASSALDARATHTVQTAIYVANRDSITTYALGSTGNVTPLTIISGPASGLSDLSGIAVDLRGNVYTVNRGEFGGKSSVRVYPPGSSGEIVPARTIAGPATDLYQPTGIAVADDGTIYITNGSWSSADGPYMPSDGDVAVYSAGSNGNVPPTGRITGRDYAKSFPHYWIYRPIGLALDGRLGKLYVLNPGNEGVAKYRTDSRDKAPPLGRIAGPITALTRARGIAVDPHGNIFVTDAEANAVMEYAHGSNGDVTPVATIMGPATGLSEPGGVALDGSGDIFVVNSRGGGIFSTGTVTEYAAGSNGNVTPIATIAGPFTELADPRAITIGVLPR